MNRLTRREFSVSAAAASVATGLVAGVHTSSRAAAADTKAEQLGVAVCGVNSRGMAHVGGFHHDPRTIIRVLVDVDSKVGEQRADQVEKTQGVRPRVVSDVREVLDADDVQIVTAATPNHWHAIIGVWAMQAGKDVYIEKPVSHNIDEGRALVAAAKKYERMFQTGSQCRSSKACIDAVKFMADGGIGDVNLARGLCYKRRKSIGELGDYAVPPTVDYSLWSGPAEYTTPKVTRPKFHYDWHWQRLYGNGDSGNQGPHQTDISRWGMGLDRHPNTILSYGGRLGYQAERKNPDYVDAGDTANTQVAIYDYGDKTIVFETRGLSVDNSADEELNALFQSKNGNKIGVVFYGSDGYVVQTSYDLCRVYDRNMNQTREFTHDSRSDGDLVDVHVSNFIDAVVSRDASALTADARVGHLSAAMAHHANVSYYLGDSNKSTPAELAAAVEAFKSRDDDAATLERTLQHLRDNGVDLEVDKLSLGPVLNFDLETERYIDNDAANAMLTRDYREDFTVPSPADV
ncbi:Gfo/Idh/MocA family protein [Allorhodopirellula heiligendammensis]|uniref:Oxidoreductase n=1 Tax=Allorhodopirellula heiligendammensis TaxID=2714739 RepID=A0A5C6BUX7_9BACT|nr:Gfo/Idh/MocA family oxidoreductase [Allorhodopirellula heiligendammensis]TWU16083.1 putative oxidoreductase [Allorhodopirellula heiligendammensis]